MISLRGVSVKIHAQGCTVVISYTQPTSDKHLLVLEYKQLTERKTILQTLLTTAL